MDNSNSNKIKGNKNIIEQVLKIPVELTHRNKNKQDLNKKKFEELVLVLEQIENRTYLINDEFNLDLSKYDELYYIVINNLLDLLYPVDIVNLIKFYCYGRIDDEGKIRPIIDNENNEIFLNNPQDLYNLIQTIVYKK